MNNFTYFVLGLLDAIIELMQDLGNGVMECITEPFEYCIDRGKSIVEYKKILDSLKDKNTREGKTE